MNTKTKSRSGEDHSPKDSMLFALVHEMSQPLTALRGSLELALRRGRSLRDYRRAAEKAIAAADALVAIAESVRELAEAQASPTEFAPVELDQLTRAVVDDLMPVAELRAVKVQLDGTQGITARAAEQGLYRGLVKLMHFVILRTPPRGKLAVALSNCAGDACIGIQFDSGRPPAEMQDQGRPKPADDSEKSADDWDLLVASRTIEASGGRVATEQTARGGCRITISIPRAI